MDQELRDLERRARNGDVAALRSLQAARDRLAPTAAERARYLVEALALRFEREHGKRS